MSWQTLLATCSRRSTMRLLFRSPALPKNVSAGRGRTDFRAGCPERFGIFQDTLRGPRVAGDVLLQGLDLVLEAGPGTREFPPSACLGPRPWWGPALKNLLESRHGESFEEEHSERQSPQACERGPDRDGQARRPGSRDSPHCGPTPGGQTPGRGPCAGQGPASFAGQDAFADPDAAADGRPEPVALAGAGRETRLPDLPGPRRRARPAPRGLGAGRAGAHARHAVS